MRSISMRYPRNPSFCSYHISLGWKSGFVRDYTQKFVDWYKERYPNVYFSQRFLKKLIKRHTERYGIDGARVDAEVGYIGQFGAFSSGEFSPIGMYTLQPIITNYCFICRKPFHATINKECMLKECWDDYKFDKSEVSNHAYFRDTCESTNCRKVTAWFWKADYKLVEKCKKYKIIYGGYTRNNFYDMPVKMRGVFLIRGYLEFVSGIKLWEKRNKKQGLFWRHIY